MARPSLTTPTFMLLPGSMCDARIWNWREGAIRTACGSAPIDADLTHDDSIAAMAARALANAPGMLVAVGFSMGGNVALEMARQGSERIAALALIDVNPAADLPPRAAARLAHQADVRHGGLAAVMGEALALAYFARGRARDPAAEALVMDMSRALGKDVFVRQSEALRTRADLRSMVEHFDGPIFLACGADDQLCTPVMHETMARAASCATLAVIEGAGHMLPLEQPGALAKALGDWIEKSGLCAPRKAYEGGAGGAVAHRLTGGEYAC